jgi:hypothetical protein
MNKRVTRKLGVGILALGLAVSASIFGLQQALAATGSIYVTPASNSVQVGNSFTVSVRISPGTTVDSVQGTVGFDASKLQLVSVNTASSAFTTELQNTTSSGSVVFARGDFGAGASTDSLIESITFKALASSGSGSISLSGANADASGSFTNPSSTGASVSFTAAPVATPTCPSGQTGTPPNCVTPVTGGSGTSGGTSSGGSKTPTTKTPTSTTTTPSTTSSPAPTGASTPTAAAPAPTVTAQKVLYTQAELSFTSKTPTKVYVRFGLDDQLTTNTAETDFSTTHVVTIDPSLLVPGEHYSYVVVATDQQGGVVQSTVQHFTTKGLTLTMGVFDTNHNPLRGKTVTLHSSPQTAKTDKNGFVTFTGVAPGDHQVLYTAGKKTYTQQVTVVNNVQSSGSTQTATAQNFSVVYGFTQSDLHIAVWVWILLAVAILGLLGKTGRLGFALRLRNPRSPELLGTQPVIVNATTSSTTPSVMSATPNLARVEERLKAIPGPAAPRPGLTITPQAPTPPPSNDSNDGQGVDSGRL